jgi:hypothetical protein
MGAVRGNHIPDIKNMPLITTSIGGFILEIPQMPLTPDYRARRAHLLAIHQQSRNGKAVGIGLIAIGLCLLAHGLYRDGPALLRTAQNNIQLIQERFKQ